MSQALRASAEDDTNSANEFKLLAQRYAEIAAAEAIKVTPFASADIPLFMQASTEQRAQAIEFLRTMVTVLDETLTAGHRAVNSAQLLWRALSRLSLTPGPGVFDRLGEEDGAVVVYSLEQKVLFWNLQFFKNVSLTIEQLLFSAWYEVTERPKEIKDALYNLALKLVNGEITGDFETHVPGHEVKEIGSLECLRTWMEIPWGTTLSQDGKTAGFLIVQRMKLLD